MAIQMRRGAYTNYDPTKLVPGEIAVVQSGDPIATDGKAVYIAITAGSAKRLILYDEAQSIIHNYVLELITFTDPDNNGNIVVTVGGGS